MLFVARLCFLHNEPILSCNTSSYMNKQWGPASATNLIWQYKILPFYYGQMESEHVEAIFYILILNPFHLMELTTHSRTTKLIYNSLKDRCLILFKLCTINKTQLKFSTVFAFFLLTLWKGGGVISVYWLSFRGNSAREVKNHCAIYKTITRICGPAAEGWTHSHISLPRTSGLSNVKQLMLTKFCYNCERKEFFLNKFNSLGSIILWCI
jgi:hypothetical protein